MYNGQDLIDYLLQWWANSADSRMLWQRMQLQAGRTVNNSNSRALVIIVVFEAVFDDSTFLYKMLVATTGMEIRLCNLRSN